MSVTFNVNRDCFHVEEGVSTYRFLEWRLYSETDRQNLIFIGL